MATNNDTIIRVQKTKNYTVIDNQPIEDENLSPEALGVLVYLLSKPDNWQVRNQELMNRFNLGRKKLDRIIKELKETGYIERQRKQSNDGKFHYETIVRERSPLYQKGTTDEGTVVPLSVDGKGDNIVSTDIPSTNLNNNNKENQLFSENLSQITEMWQSEISVSITPIIADALKQFAARPFDEFKYAVEQAVSVNARNLRYITAIMNNIKTSGGLIQHLEKRNKNNDNQKHVAQAGRRNGKASGESPGRKPTREQELAKILQGAGYQSS